MESSIQLYLRPFLMDMTRAQAERMVSTLLELGVFVRKPYAPPIDGYIRVTVGTPAEREAFGAIFAEALARVREKASA